MLARRMTRWGKVSTHVGGEEMGEQYTYLQNRCDGVSEGENGGFAEEVLGSGEDLEKMSLGFAGVPATKYSYASLPT